MRKTLAVGSICIIAVLVVAGFTPALASKPSQSQTTMLVPVEVTNSFGARPVTSRTMVTPEAADQIRALASQLSGALDRRDMQTAAACVHMLQQYGIAFGPRFLPLMNFQDMFSPRMTSLFGPDANLSNSACILNAHGEGMLAGYFTEKILQNIAATLHNITNIIVALVTLLVFLPIILVVILFNDLIPIRLMMPHGTLVLANGTISTRGADGHKTVTLSGASHAQVNVTLFTGISLNILPISGHKAACFIYGFAAKTEGYIA